jgi:hypothetical protein
MLRRLMLAARALEHVTVVGFPAVGHVRGDLRPGALGIVAEEEFHAAAHAGVGRIVAAGRQTLAVGRQQVRVDRLQAQAKLARQPRALRPAEPAPHRHRSLCGRRGDQPVRSGNLAPERPHRLDPLAEHAVATFEVATEGFVLGPAVAHAESRLDAPATDEIDQRDLFGGLQGAVQGQQRHRRPDPQGPGSRGDGRREGPALGQVAVVEEVVLGQPN